MKTYEFKTDKIHFVLSRIGSTTRIQFFKMDEEIRDAGDLFNTSNHYIVSQVHPELGFDRTYFPGNDEDRDNELRDLQEIDEYFMSRLNCITLFMKQRYNWGKVTRVIPWL